jgi:hypothetical protein
MEEYQADLGGGNPTGCATLKIFGLVIPVTHTEIVEGFEIFGGKSLTTFVERCEFLASLIGNSIPRKGVLCTLQPNPTATPIEMQLWDGGLQPGGAIYRFRLVSAYYKG